MNYRELIKELKIWVGRSTAKAMEATNFTSIPISTMLSSSLITEAKKYRRERQIVF